MQRLGVDGAALKRAADLLRAGELVAFPTETVYGLGADAANPGAVARIFAAKGRPADHPLIVHLPDAGGMQRWGRDLPDSAQALAEAFWPGPLTLIVRRGEGVSDLVTGGQDTIGLRVPAHPVARALLREFGGALAAPSANRFGHISPTRAEHVVSEFDDEVAAVVDGGACPVGVESTIVDLSGASPRLLRPGMIRPDSIAVVLGEPLATTEDREGPRASGRLASHYAPRAPLERVDREDLGARIDDRVHAGERVVVLARRATPAGRDGVTWIEMPVHPVQYARALYSELRRADAGSPDRILIERLPATPGWDAIRDRIRRAAS